MKKVIGWGIILWLVGYILSFLLFFMVPPSMIGWVIAPIGTALTWLVLIKKIKVKNYLVVSLVWTLWAVILDYLFIVKMLRADTYYKPSVYFYYLVTFGLPLVAGWRNK